MLETPPENVYVALLHYPVYDKNHREIATCITNLDLHDMARCSATYGVKGFYLVTPMASQREYARKLMAHWLEGGGGCYNPCRKEALETVRVVAELQDALTEINAAWGTGAKTVATGASQRKNCISHTQLRKIIFEHSRKLPYIIIFGTGWGLSEKIVQQTDHILEPITGVGEYNHLSVRSASAITLDRLLRREAALGNADDSGGSS